MTSDELARIVAAMTQRPWTQDECIIDCGPGAEARRMLYNTDTVTPLGPNADGNLAGVVALANHADALVELVRACERLVAGNTMGRDHAPARIADLQLRAMELERAAGDRAPGCGCCDCEVRKALDKTHAVGKEGKDA